ncbi:MAG: Rrf2 family transcriptional regulator [Bacteroidetes bacterium]|nr:Rrf2 family transcriptional regulator [Bacteroidota bacterium]MBU1677714.1 Rrf2 family transcriptional regulator [Bacteroidota bacterium]MBU2508097.1 Rrf2 family transcriptional regulator [Bacteroidota bacterium]
MKLNSQTKYAIQSLMFLLAKKRHTIVPAHLVAQELGLPKEFVSKILQKLAQNGVLNSKKGKFGGFYTQESSIKTKMRDLVQIFESEKIMRQCVLGFKDCDACDSCELGKFNKDYINLFLDMPLKNMIAEHYNII